MSCFDAVREYLERRGVPLALVRGGLPGLARRWEEVVGGVEGGYALGIEDYLNDVDVRNLIAGALRVAEPEQAAAILPRVEAADARFRDATMEGPCIWGRQIELDEGYTPAKQWWYYRRPKRAGPELAGELGADAAL